MKFYTSLSKGSKLKVRKFLGLIPTFVEVTGEKLVREDLFAPPILNRVNEETIEKAIENTTAVKSFVYFFKDRTIVQTFSRKVT